MKTYTRKFWRLIIAMILVMLSLPGLFVQAAGTQQEIRVIAIDGEINPAMAAFLERSLTAAENDGAAGVIIEIRTLGGQVASAVDMRDAILNTGIPVAVYISNRAESAGALISIAADTIIMAPGSHIGAAEPIPLTEKTLAFVSGEFRTTAERNGRDPQIAAAMADKSIEITGLVKAGEILDMTAEEASAWGYADIIAASREDALKAMDWSDARITEVRPDFRFQLALFLTSYEIASLLLIIGLLAMLVEFFTPGFGVPGFVSIVCFILYFAGGFLAGYTDWWAAVIFVAGLILLIIELVVPGFGVFGITGIIAIFVSIVFAAPSLNQGLITLLIALVVLIVAVPVFFKIFGRSRLMQRFVLAQAETSAKGFVHAPAKSSLQDKNGSTLTVLRPAGSALIDGQRVDVLTEGEFIGKGEKIRVIRVEGTKVIVAADAENLKN